MMYVLGKKWQRESFLILYNLHNHFQHAWLLCRVDFGITGLYNSYIV